MAPTRAFRLKMAELAHLLERRILAELESYDGMFDAEVQLWERVKGIVKEQYPDAKWTYKYVKKEWESHPLQRYIKAVLLRFPHLELTDSLSLEEWREYLIWRSENHQGIKEWRRYGRPKRDSTPKSGETKQAKNTPKGTRAYVPRRKKGGSEEV